MRALKEKVKTLEGFICHYRHAEAHWEDELATRYYRDQDPRILFHPMFDWPHRWHTSPQFEVPEPKIQEHHGMDPLLECQTKYGTMVINNACRIRSHMKLILQGRRSSTFETHALTENRTAQKTQNSSNFRSHSKKTANFIMRRQRRRVLAVQSKVFRVGIW